MTMYIPSRLKIKHNLPKYPGGNWGQTDFYTMKCLKWQKSYRITYMDDLATKSQRLFFFSIWFFFHEHSRITGPQGKGEGEVCFNQEKLPITCHNFCHKSLVKLKSKFPNWQGPQAISYKANLSQKESMHAIDVKLSITHQNNQGGN